jgi:hypothetical protein
MGIISKKTFKSSNQDGALVEAFMKTGEGKLPERIKTLVSSHTAYGWLVGDAIQQTGVEGEHVVTRQYPSNEELYRQPKELFFA